MGACMSSGELLIATTDGDVESFHKKFIEDAKLGEGEFGVVKRVYETTDSAKKTPLACKTLKKGMTFKDNQLYPALPPEMLRGEITMLRALQASSSNNPNYCLQLHSIYEDTKVILMVTELCAGGEMLEYVAKQEQLRTEDISRIAFQLITAIDFCARKKIIHRDLKPANIMFTTDTPKAELRVIDFGAGVQDEQENQFHTTFAGTPFYNSPEIFQQKYTQKTDVFSVGVTLYVLTAGYPADCLQKAFNLLQKAKRDLKKLPNMPQNMPESFYDLLNGLLVYHAKQRKTAGQLVDHAFCTFHKELEKEEAEEAKQADGGVDVDDVGALPTTTPRPNKRPSMLKSQSFSVQGAVERHTLMLSYQDFERSLTTLLATLLTQPELAQLLELVQKHQANQAIEEEGTEHTTGSASEQPVTSPPTEPDQLGVIPLHRLLEIVKKDLKNDDVVTRANNLPNAASYAAFAYHTALLQDFVKPTYMNNTTTTNKDISGEMEKPNPKQRRHSALTNTRRSALGGNSSGTTMSSMRDLSKWSSTAAGGGGNTGNSGGGALGRLGSSFRKSSGPRGGGMSRAQSVMIPGV